MAEVPRIPMLRVRRVHGTALTLAATGDPAVEFGVKLGRINALGQAMPVAAVGRKNVVLPGQVRTRRTIG